MIKNGGNGSFRVVYPLVRLVSSLQGFNTSGIHFLNFFNDPRIIREQSIAAYKGYRGGGHMGDDVESLGAVLERLWCKVEVDGDDEGIEGIQRRYSGAQAAVGRGGDMMRFGPLLITTGFHKVRVSCVGGVRWGEVEEMRDIFGMGEWMIILRVEEEDLRGSGVVGIGTGEGWRGRVEQKWFEAVFGEVSLGKGECRRGIVVDGLEEVVGVFVWQGTIGLYLSYADTCYGETDRQFVQTKGNSKVYLLSVYHIDVGKELSVFATTQRPAASVFRAKEMLHNQLPDEHPNLCLGVSGC
ncbi:hypothetical protein Tco_0796723 [Tanacetum coccineum]